MTHPRTAPDLARLMARTALAKTAALKQAAADPVTGVENGTQEAVAGPRATENKSDAGEYTAAATDGGAVTNQEGASVAKATDGATATAADGSKGGEAGENADPSKAEGSAKIAAELRKVAADLEAHLNARNARVRQDKLAMFLIQEARNSSDPQIKTAAEQGEDADVGDQAIASLLEQLQSGQITEEQAMQMLEEAVKSGAISQEEVQEAMSQMQGQQVQAEGGAVPPEAEAEAQEKLAAADIDPDRDPALYSRKLAHFYADEIEAGRRLGLHYAGVLRKQAAAVEAQTKTASVTAPVVDTVEAKAALEKIAAETHERLRTELGLSQEEYAAVLATEVPQAKTAAEKIADGIRGQVLAKIAHIQTPKA